MQDLDGLDGGGAGNEDTREAHCDAGNDSGARRLHERRVAVEVPGQALAKDQHDAVGARPEHTLPPPAGALPG